MADPKEGQFLYASCAGEDYGKILRVYEEDGVRLLDIELYDLQSLCDSIDAEEEGPEPTTRIEVPDGTAVILREVQYNPTKPPYQDMIVCNTPGDGCYRCTKLFQIRDTTTRFVWVEGRGWVSNTSLNGWRIVCRPCLDVLTGGECKTIGLPKFVDHCQKCGQPLVDRWYPVQSLTPRVKP